MISMIKSAEGLKKAITAIHCVLWRLSAASSLLLCIDTLVSMTRITLNLHHIYSDSRAIDDALQQAFDEAIIRKIKEVEIVAGKNSGQLLNKVERFLRQPDIKKYYHRMSNEGKKLGKLVVFFKF